jgi:RNA polymerase sigma-70 factor (ECF subfamily)
MSVLSATAAPLDMDAPEWRESLRAPGRAGDVAVARLHALLLRAARFEVARRAAGMPHLRGNELDDIALEAADDALVSVLQRLDDFRGDSRFSTWVYKFAVLEAAVKLRKRAWQGRERPLEPEAWNAFVSNDLGWVCRISSNIGDRTGSRELAGSNHCGRRFCRLTPPN